MVSVACLQEFFASQKLWTLATVVGALYLLRLTLGSLCCLCSFLKAYCLAPCGIFRTNLKKYGPWAVVTGASEGIGRAYATELAKRGLNVVIISRSQDKLQKVADEIKDKYSVEVKVVAVDFTAGQDIYPQIAQELQDLDVGVLVNNVGMSYEHADFLIQVPAERLRSVIEVNCQSMVQMTKLFLPKMVERKRGVVINLSSTSGVVPMALLTVYSASKSFVNCFSDGLKQEYASKGIIVQNITPAYVTTSMSGIRRTSLFVPSPASFARSALNAVGILSHTAGYTLHVLQLWFMMLLPRCIIDHFVMKALIQTRDRYLRKKARQKED